MRIDPHVLCNYWKINKTPSSRCETYSICHVKGEYSIILGEKSRYYIEDIHINNSTSNSLVAEFSRHAMLSCWFCKSTALSLSLQSPPAPPTPASRLWLDTDFCLSNPCPSTTLSNISEGHHRILALSLWKVARPICINAPTECSYNEIGVQYEKPHRFHKCCDNTHYTNTEQEKGAQT